MRLFKSPRAARPIGALRLPSARPALEHLESRLVPYAATGNAWPNPQLITISFVPDGTVLALGNGGQITSNLFATFNNIPGVTSPSVWQDIILKAAQSWAAQTNINFAVVPDDGSAAGTGLFQQGAPDIGDIRIGGFNFGSGNTWLASTFYPPPANNYSIAGDVTFNTAYSFNIGSTFDLFTVAAHEIGHALGLGLSNSSTAVMYSTYNGAFAALGTDDIAGIRYVYSNGNPRATDAYDTGAGDNSFATAADITSTISPLTLSSVVNNLSITSTIGTKDTVTSADVAYYKFTAPALSAPTMSVSVQSAGLSLLSPMVTVYASDQRTVLGTANGRGQYGTTLTLSGIPVTPGSVYYIKVQGADTTVFSDGEYALTLNLGILPNPVVPLPITTTLNGTPLQSGGGQPMFAEPPAPTLLPAGTHFADATVVSSLGSHTTFAPVVVPTPQTGAAAPITTAAVAAPTTARIDAPLGGVVNGVGNTPTEERGAQPAPPPEEDAVTPEESAVPSQAVPDDGTAAACDACLTAETEAAAPSSSADAVSDASSDDWTPDGALATASVVFAGTWLRRDAAHKAEEKLAHILRTPARPKAR
jgi:hypothetical protein